MLHMNGLDPEINQYGNTVSVLEVIQLIYAVTEPRDDGTQVCQQQHKWTWGPKL